MKKNINTLDVKIQIISLLAAQFAWTTLLVIDIYIKVMDFRAPPAPPRHQALFMRTVRA
jgi:hypothetical protein